MAMPPTPRLLAPPVGVELLAEVVPLLLEPVEVDELLDLSATVEGI